MIKQVTKDIVGGILAGIMVTIGCAVYLATENKYVGAVMFSVALITICYLKFSLYTGKIGLMPTSYTKEDFSTLLLGLLGNVIAMALFGMLLRYAIPSMFETANKLVLSKLENQLWWQTLIRGFFCGILMYVAVIVYKEKNSPIGILFCIPVFILSGFEHSIADMGYFAIGGVYSFDAFLFIMLVVIGNTLGGLIIPLLRLFQKDKVNS